MTTLGYALLGILARGSLSGYDLARNLQMPVGYFWQANHSHIYPELARLEAEGLVRHEVVLQEQRPSKKIYTLTDTGRATLQQWVSTPGEIATPRDELLLKIFSLWLLERKQATALIREQEQRFAEQLAQFEAIQATLAATFGATLHDSGSPAFCAYATSQCGLLRVRSQLDWCRWLLEQLEQPPADRSSASRLL